MRSLSLSADQRRLTRNCRKLKEKEMKRKLRKAAKKENDDGAFKDSVKFGEVAQAPPSLTAKPKVKVRPLN